MKSTSSCRASGKLGRHGARDRTLILIAYRHGLRISELVSLRCDQGDLKAALLIQLLGDVIGWLSRQQSRVGHVCLS
jgi:integrase